MPFTELEYTKSWTSVVDFPTYEDNETQIREDAQYLHDETKNFINDTLIGELESAGAASSLGAKDSNGADSTVQVELDKLTEDQHTHANKELLDSYEQTEVDLADAVTKKHGHDNKAVLDGIAAVTTVLGAAEDKVPSEKAVADALTLAGNLPPEGLIGQALVKKSGASYDTEWKDITLESLGGEPLVPTGTAEGTSTALTLACPGFVLADGAIIRFKLGIALNKGATLNVDSTGAKGTVDMLGKPFKASTGAWLTVVYNSNTENFVLQGKGGDAPGRTTFHALVTNTLNVRGW